MLNLQSSSQTLKEPSDLSPVTDRQCDIIRRGGASDRAAAEHQDGKKVNYSFILNI